MSQGLQIWDASGELVLDTKYRVAKLIGRVTTGTSNGSISVPAFSKGIPIFYGILDSSAQVNPYWQYHPSISVAGNTLSWFFSDSYPQYRASVIITYGYY